MLIQVLCKNASDLVGSILGTYFEKSQIYLPTVKHLFLNRYYDTNQGFFFSTVFQDCCAFSWSL